MTNNKIIAMAVSLVFMMILTPKAYGWGVPLPGGPPPQCNDSGVHDSQTLHNKLQLGLGMGSLHSTLRFDASQDVEIEMVTSSVSGSYRLNDKLSIRTGFGFIGRGKLVQDNHSEHEFVSGGMLALGVEYMWTQAEGLKPYIDYSVNVSASTATLREHYLQEETQYFASDLRLGARATWKLGENIFPSFSGRVFGGPVSWELDGENVTGTDIHHYQIAVGLAVQYGQYGIFTEWAGLGEKALSFGLGYSL